MSTQEEQPTAAERRLLKAAMAAFAELGYGGSTTRDIAARAGRSPAAVYIHYSSKEELLFAISMRGYEDGLRQLTGIFDAPGDPTARLRAMVFDFSLWHLQNADLGRVMQYELHALAPAHRAEVATMRHRFQRLMVAALEQGIASGEFDIVDVEGTARALLSLSIDLARWYSPTGKLAPQEIAALNARLALRMIAAA